jgi:hypothetical protein
MLEDERAVPTKLVGRAELEIPAVCELLKNKYTGSESVVGQLSKPAVFNV